MGSAEFGTLVFPAVVAHRGASSSHPENTLEAFRAAVDAGADMIELDVRLTADGVPVVLHDANVSGTTDGTGFVSQLTLADVKKLDASGGRGSRLEIPTLREALELLSDRAGLDIEIKNIPGDPDFDSPTESVANEVVKLLDEMAFAGTLLVTSFNWLSIERVRELNPSIPTGLLSVAGVDVRQPLAHAKEKGHAFILPHVKALFEAGDSFVAQAHAGGLRVGTWTVDDPPRIEQLFAWDVDAVITNDPAAAVPIRDAARVARRAG